MNSGFWEGGRPLIDYRQLAINPDYSQNPTCSSKRVIAPVDRRVSAPPQSGCLADVTKKIGQTPHQLTSALVQVEAKLSQQRICNRHLGKGKSGDGELANAEDSDSKLRNGHDAVGKLADGDKSFRRHRPAIRTILERDVHEGQAEDG